MLKKILKTIYTYLFNWYKIRKFHQFGRGNFIGRRLIYKPAGDGLWIGDNVRIGNDCRFSLYNAESHTASIKIDDGTYMGSNNNFLTADSIIIEKNVLMASNISIIGENHGINPESKIKYGLQPLHAAPICIKQNSWIGQNVIIVIGNSGNGITIGQGAIVGAGSVVTRDVPDYSIVVGNPAHVIKKYNFERHCWETTEK